MEGARRRSAPSRSVRVFACGGRTGATVDGALSETPPARGSARTDVFLAIKGLTFEGNAIIFAVITSFTGVALYFSYLNASTQKKAGYVRASAARSRRGALHQGCMGLTLSYGRRTCFWAVVHTRRLEQARRAQKSNFSGSSALSKQERKTLLQAHEVRAQCGYTWALRKRGQGRMRTATRHMRTTTMRMRQSQCACEQRQCACEQRKERVMGSAPRFSAPIFCPNLLPQSSGPCSALCSGPCSAQCFGIA